MDVGVLLPLAGLALIDSTSVGTLVLPLWLMLAPGRVRVGRILTFLGAVAGCYLLIGVLLLLGAAELAGPVGAALESTGGRVLQLVAGTVLVVLGLTVEPWTKAGKERRRAARAARGPGRLARWRDRARGDGPAGAVVTLAVVAVGILAGYCLLMVLPALVLPALRVTLHERLTPVLTRVEGRLSRASGETVAWVLFLLGLYLVADASPIG